MKKLSVFLMAAAVLGLSSCMNEDKLAKTLKEKPEIIFEAIKANPAAFMKTIQEVAETSKTQREEMAFEESFKNPLKPQIRDDEAMRGPKDAPLVLVEYSDFECPYCTRGFGTVTELMEKYKGKIKFIYKHLPLSFHKQAMIAAQYFEAIRLQNEDKAFEFHDEIFKNQRKLKNGKSFLDAVAKKLGVNMSKLAKDIKSKEVNERIKQDMAEAAKFGIQGTPGFVLNGIAVRGAYPASHFDKIIKELQKRDLVKL